MPYRKMLIITGVHARLRCCSSWSARKPTRCIRPAGCGATAIPRTRRQGPRLGRRLVLGSIPRGKRSSRKSSRWCSWSWAPTFISGRVLRARRKRWRAPDPGRREGECVNRRLRLQNVLSSGAVPHWLQRAPASGQALARAPKKPPGRARPIAIKIHVLEGSGTGGVDPLK